MDLGSSDKGETFFAGFVVAAAAGAADPVSPGPEILPFFEELLTSFDFELPRKSGMGPSNWTFIGFFTLLMAISRALWKSLCNNFHFSSSPNFEL